MRFTRAFAKSVMLRVATVNPLVRAVAAIRLSLIGMARPAFFKSAMS